MTKKAKAVTPAVEAESPGPDARGSSSKPRSARPKSKSKHALSIADMNLPTLRPGDKREQLEELAFTEDESTSFLPVDWKPGVPALVGRHYLVPLEFLRDNPNNARAIYGSKDIAQLAQSLAARGQLQAAQAYAPNGEVAVFTLKEGHTRARAAKRAGLKHLIVEVVSEAADGMTDYLESRELNVRRHNVTIFDDAVRFQELMDSTGVSQSELAASVGVTEEYVSKALRIGRLPRVFLERMAFSREPSFGTAMAYLVAQFHDVAGMNRADRLVTNIIAEKLSVRRVEQMLAEAKATKDPAGATKSRRRLMPLSRSELSGPGSSRGELKLFPDGRIELALSHLPAELRDAVYSKLVRSFEDAGLTVTGFLPQKN